MAYDFNGSNQGILGTPSPLGGTVDEPLTLACWVNMDNATADQTLITVCNHTDGNNSAFYRLAMRGNQAGDPFEAAKYNGSTTGSAFSSPGMTTGTWHHVAAVFASDASRTIYIDGVGTENTTSVTDAAQTFTRVGIAALQRSTAITHADARIADVGVWACALTAAQVGQLAAGMIAEKVCPQDLVFHAPLIRDLIDTISASSLTNTNTATAAAHPRVYA